MARLKISKVIKIAALVFYFLLAFFVSRGQVTSDFTSSGRCTQIDPARDALISN